MRNLPPVCGWGGESPRIQHLFQVGVVETAENLSQEFSGDQWALGRRSCGDRSVGSLTVHVDRATPASLRVVLALAICRHRGAGFASPTFEEKSLCLATTSWLGPGSAAGASPRVAGSCRHWRLLVSRRRVRPGLVGVRACCKRGQSCAGFPIDEFIRRQCRRCRRLSYTDTRDDHAAPARCHAPAPRRR